MNAVPFDTLKMAQRLEAAGFSRPQAAGAAEALAEALSGADLATKGDLASLQTAVTSDIEALRAEMKSDSAAGRHETKSEFALLRRDMEVMRRDMVIKLGAMMFVAVGVILAAMRYLPPHP